LLALFALGGLAVDFQDGRLCDGNGTVFILLAAAVVVYLWHTQQRQGASGIK
jgi:hypothetical protein